MKKIFICLISLLLVFTSLTACSSPAANESESGKSNTNGDKIKIAATIFPVYDWIRNVAGDNAEVSYLERTGADLHSFEPTAKDILALKAADIFICVGGVSDKWVDSAVKTAENPDLIVLNLIGVVNAVEEETVEGMEPEKEEADDNKNGEKELDEHIWLSLKNAEKAVLEITETLKKADARNADDYEKNSADYISKLSSLDKKYEETVENAKRNTLLFADRFPFRYLTEDYGIEYYAAFTGCSAESEASFETMSFLISKTKELKLPCVLTIEGSDKKIADSVSSATGAKILTLNSCQSVTEKDSDGGLTYLKVMENNLTILGEALN